MKIRFCICFVAVAGGASAWAQAMDHSMHQMPMNETVKAPPDPHAGHDMSAVSTVGNAAKSTESEKKAASDPHAGHNMAAMPEMASPGEESSAPSPPMDRAGDRYFDPKTMAAAREQLRAENGGMLTSMVLINLAEYQIRDGRDGYRWDAEGWFGGDIDRLVVKSEGEGARSRKIETAETQALWGHAISPYFNLQGGIRFDIEPNPSRGYAVLGVEGIAPYWFHFEATAFLSQRGEFRARFKTDYDLRVTQRLIFQPRVELDFAGRDISPIHVGSGFSKAELGGRLRYEVEREFAPYIGISQEWKLGRTADFTRAAGDEAQTTSVAVGVRSWF